MSDSESLCWIFCCCFKTEYVWKGCKKVDWNSVLLVLVTFVSFIVGVSSEGQDHTTLQWTCTVDTKQGNRTLCQALCRCGSHWQAQVVFWNLVALCFLRMRSSQGPGCDSPSLVHPSLVHLSLPRSSVSLCDLTSVLDGWFPIALLATDFSPHSNSWKDPFLNQRHPALHFNSYHSFASFKSFWVFGKQKASKALRL